LGFHDQAGPAAEAAYAADQQGKFWEYHDQLFLKQQSLSEGTYVAIAKELKLDMDKFNRDRNGQAAANHIRLDIQVAKALEANGTPAFVVNGRLEFGALPFDTIKSMVETQIAAVTERMKQKKEDIPNARAFISENNHKRAKLGIAYAPIDGAATRGGEEALVTAVVFSDFQ